MDNIPGENEWGSPKDLDQKHAKLRFYGLNKFEAANIFSEYTVSASEDLTNMPIIVLEYYLESLYIALAESSFDSIGKLAVDIVMEYVVEQLSDRSQLCRELLDRILRRFLSRKLYFGLESSRESVLLIKLNELSQ